MEKDIKNNLITINYLSLLKSRIVLEENALCPSKAEANELVKSIDSLKAFLSEENDYLNFRLEEEKKGY